MVIIDTLKAQLLRIIEPELFLDDQQYRQFLSFVESGKITKETNPTEHCCVFFIPFNPKTQEIFIVDHKKARQWIVPGGHVEARELLEDTLRREAKEELGISMAKILKPFLFTVMNVHSEGQSCKVHYDVWYLIPNTGELNVDYTEFNTARWVNKQRAKELITHKVYLQGIERIAGF